MKFFRSLITGSIAALALSASGAFASTITNGFTFAVASGCGSTTTGTHFHSNTGGVFGNPSGKAEVGSFGGASCEEVRGLSEYDLAGLTSSPTAFVSFNVFQDMGLFTSNNYAYTGNIQVVAYQGNNTEDTSDYQAPLAGSVGSFSAAGLVAGDILSFDITSIFNDAITNGWSSLGIRLRIASAPNGGAITFDSFRLTSDNQSTVPIGGDVPVPAGAPLLLTGMAAFGLVARRKRGKKA